MAKYYEDALSRTVGVLAHPAPVGAGSTRASTSVLLPTIAVVVASLAACAHPNGPGAASAVEPTTSPAAASPASYPQMAPLAQYMMADEVALARSAAPSAVSDAAEVLVFGERGYASVQHGSNGFVCIVERAWASPFDSSEFWNPRIRAPNCYNAAAARTVMPAYLKRTEWALAGMSKEQIMAKAKAAVAAGDFPPPEVGSMCFMMSKGGYLSDEVGGHWHPHLMFFLPRMKPAEWGANQKGTPVFAFAGDSGAEANIIFLVPVPSWSDGVVDARHM
jgi:hypothetical protein